MRGEGKEVVKLLLSKGANVNDKDNDGRSPLDFASLHGHVEIKSILKKWGSTIATAALQEHYVHHLLDFDYLSEIDEFMNGPYREGGRRKTVRKHKKKKSKNNKKKRKTIRKRR